MKTIKLVLIFLLLSGFAMAQNGIIKGRVVDTDQQPLPGANIILNNSFRLGTVSNVNGEYFFNRLPAGEYSIEVSYIGFAGQSQTITIEEGKTFVVNFELEAGIELEEVVINSRLVGESKALNTQKNAINITNIVSSEQLERFPDANIGDALKRIPGINVQYDQGEARFGNIRGTAPELNSITINGERIPSAEAEIRSVQLDLVSSDMIETVEYNKAVTPDMDADAIGGSVNLITKQAPYKSQLSGKIGTGWNFVADKMSFRGSLSYSDRFLNDKLGMVLGLSVYDNKLGSDNIEAEWDYEDNNSNDLYDAGDDVYTSEIQNRQYYLERFRQSYSASFDYKFNERHQLYFNGIYNKRDDWENRYRLEVKDIEDNGDGTFATELVRQTKFGIEDNKYSRLEDQRMMSFGLGGEHLFGKMKIDWMAAYSKASEERPNERYIEYEAEDDIILDLSNMEEPAFTYSDPANYGDFTSAWEFGELTEEYQYTEEIDMNFRLNFELPLLTGDYANKLKFGVRYRGKEKKRDNWFREYEPVDEDAFNALVLANLEDISKDDFMAGDYELGQFVDREISDKIDLNSADFDGELDESEEAGDFDATEDIIAGYLMLTQDIKEKFTIIAGVRLEQTNLEYQGKQWDNDNELLTSTPKEDDSYLSILPGLHLNYALNKNSNVRFAWTNTIARPNYFDLVPYVEIDRDDSEIKFGNPELEPTKSMNFDLMYEYFFKSIGLASAGFFYKDLTDVIGAEYQSDYLYGADIYDQARKPVNIADATLFGIEAAFSRRLDFLPSFLKNITFYGNYTYVKSKLDNIEISGREDDDIPLSGSPEHTYNLSLAYDTKKLDVRVSFNHASDFLNINDDGGIGSEAFYDVYYDKVNYLDVNADYSITENWMVYLNANNLLNQPLRTYWGESERTMQAEYYGIKFQLGLKFKF